MRSQPLIKKPPAARSATQKAKCVSRALIILHLGDVLRVERLQKSRGFCQMKLGIARLYADVEAVAAGTLRETTDVENRVMRARQAVESNHAEDGAERSAEYGEFEGDRDERRPAVKRAPGNVHRVADNVDPIFEPEAAEAAGKSAAKSEKGNQIAAEAESFRQSFNRKRGVRVHLLIAGIAHLLRGVQQLVDSFKLADQTVKLGALFHHSCSLEVWATSSRISAIEIAGSARANRKSSVVKSPRVPAKVA